MTIDASPAYFDTARQVKSAFLERMFGIAAEKVPGAAGAAPSVPVLPQTSNILGVGYGVKVTNGSGIDDLAIRVYVRAKIPRTTLAMAERVPDEIDGVPTDIIPVGDVAAQFPRPVHCGVSCGHFDITAGTIGCVVTSNGTNRFILSNSHVLATGKGALPGDRILEPGPLDGGAANPPIARLTDFQPIDFTGASNQIDAAIAELITPSDVHPQIETIGTIASPRMTAVLHQSVRKRGRTTLQTIGVVQDLGADILVRYGSRFAQFNDQIAVTGVNGPFSDEGDSGALVIDAATRRPVGLLFAGGAGTSFCNHIQNVLTRFGINIV